jgi:hypothetical protein
MKSWAWTIALIGTGGIVLLQPFANVRAQQSTAPVVSKARLTVEDFTYQGCFALGPTYQGTDFSLDDGLALRRVDGELRALFAGFHLVELRVPQTLGQPEDCPAAQLVRAWGPVPNPMPWKGTEVRGPTKTLGLYWDEPTQKLWYGFGHEYNTQWPYLPSIGAATLDPERGVISHGIWSLKDRSTKMVHGGVTAVPKWFAEQFTHGRRFAAGFGGYYSIAATGPISMGPALSAFDPEAMLAAKDKSALPNTPLVGYPFTASPYRTDRAHRDTNVINEFDGWKSRKDVGYWTWNDHVYEACQWIDLAAKSGVLCAPTLGNGRGWYYNSTLNSERGSHAWMIYDTADLAQVARGKKEEWQIQPSFQLVQYPGMNYPLYGWKGASTQRVVGMAVEGNRVYIAVRRGWQKPAFVHVYQVAG